ncbi:MAG: prepilin peptidase [Fusobacteriaceae bacterium]
MMNNDIINFELFIKLIGIFMLLRVIITDIKHLYIPNKLIVCITILGLFYNFYFKGSLEKSILGMGMYSLPYSMLYGYGSDYFNEEILGYGDVKLVMGIGGWIGYTDLNSVYIFFMMSFVVASLYCLYIFFRKKESERRIPFSPFISIGAILFLILEL